MGRMAGGLLAIDAAGVVTVTERGDTANTSEAIDPSPDPEWETVTLSDLDDQVLPLDTGAVGAILQTLSFNPTTEEFTATHVATQPGLADGVREMEQTGFDLPARFVNDGEWGVAFRLLFSAQPDTASRTIVGVAMTDDAAVASRLGQSALAYDSAIGATRIAISNTAFPFETFDVTGGITSLTVCWLPAGVPGVGGGTMGKLSAHAYQAGGTLVQTPVALIDTASSLTLPVRPRLVFGFDNATSAAGTWTFKLQRRAFKWRLGFPESDA